jgi:FdhD protein
MEFELPDEPAGYIDVPVQRRGGAGHAFETDQVAQEWPVALVFNGISHAVMMATPCDLEALAAGFALTEGIVGSRSEILDLEVVRHEASAEVLVTVGQGAFQGLKARRRSLAGRTGCGVCGIESLALLDLVPRPVAPAPVAVRPGADNIRRASLELPRFQALTRLTGALHAAAWCSPQGEVLMAVEDVGRHNALDKLVGRRALLRLPLNDGFVFLSSRASYELVRKAARVDIPMLATVSAPSSLAIRIARQAGMSLASFCRRDSFVDYTAGRAAAHLPAA